MSCNRWILFLCMLGSAAGSAAAGDWTDPTRISVEASVPFDLREVRVASDGSILAAWGETNFAGRQRVIYERITADGVACPRVIVNDDSRGGHPLFCQDRNENVHIVWLDGRLDPFGDGDLFYSLMTKDGEEIVPDTPLITGGKNVGTRFKIDIQYGEDDFVHLVTGTRTLGYRRFDLEGNMVVWKRILPLGLHYYWCPRIFPNRDGTSEVLYIDYLDSIPTAISRVYRILIDDQGNLLEGPTDISYEDDRTYGILNADRDPEGRIHYVFFETGQEQPIGSERHLRLHYGVLDSEGRRAVAPWEMAPPDSFIWPWIAMDDLGRPNVFVVAAWENDVHNAVPDWLRKPLLRFRIDPWKRSIVGESMVTTAHVDVSDLIFRADGRGGWVGIYGDWVPDPHSYDTNIVRTKPERICREGTVDAAHAFDRRTLSVNGLTGEDDHTLTVAPGTPLNLGISAVDSDPATRFYVQAWGGAPRLTEATWLPGAGLSCVNFLEHASALAVWNGLGGLRGKLGGSRVLGHGVPDPPSVPGTFFRIPGRVTSRVPPGTTITLQGVQSDSGSRKGFSLTNAIVLTIE